MILKHIPNTRGFYASATGLIFDEEGKERNYYRNGDGYVTTSVLLDNGKWRTFGVQRLVALAHISTNEDPINLTVNHIDGNVENNAVSNLEFVSVALNNIHASLLRGSIYRPTILCLNAKGSYEFISNLHKACKKFNVDYDIIWGAIRDGSLIEGCKLTYITNSAKVPDELKKRKGGLNTKRKQLRMKDIHTQQEFRYETIGSAARSHDTNSSHIFSCISSQDRVRLFKQKFLIVEEGDDFPILTSERYNELINIGGKEVLAYCEKDKTFHIFPSAAAFIRHASISKKAVTVTLKKDRLRNIKGWWFVYFTGKNSDRLKSMIGIQAS